ncbi:hypothetical protein CEXT_535851 [Caerostris extrusa]|uniref:Uncharacterized protein n=1 Tax=Caerostris extrusa TaxID=172846 RepID=A0AAV4W079_CAEEX|nr:hypothetical protein CEXT_535851 [Caerostris extrusa]
MDGKERFTPEIFSFFLQRVPSVWSERDLRKLHGNTKRELQTPTPIGLVTRWLLYKGGSYIKIPLIPPFHVFMAAIGS